MKKKIMKHILPVFIPLIFIACTVLAGFGIFERRLQTDIKDWTAGDSRWAEAFSKGSPSHGKQLYLHYCSSCHGLEGKGNGPNAGNKTLMEKPRDHTDLSYMGKRSDRQLFNVVTLGGEGMALSNLMPAFGDKDDTEDMIEGPLTPQDIWDIVAYMRTLH